MTLDSKTIAYLNELAASIVASGGIAAGQDVNEAITSAHIERQAFATEMANGVSDRSKKARRVICAKIYGGLIVNAELDKMSFENTEGMRQANFAGGVA